jgi:RsiW-degrading membrane proteinase PrsW (M82 family)
MVKVTKEIQISENHPDLNEKLFFFISGIIISIPFTVFFQNLGSMLGNYMTEFYAVLWSVAVLAPIIEEFGKAYPLFFRHGETEKSLFLIGFLIGLGFGLAEFFLYVLVFDVPPIIRLPGLIFHAANTAIVAYGVSKNQTLRYYFVAVFLHFLYNFSVILESFWYIVAFITVLVNYSLFFFLFKKVREN